MEKDIAFSKLISADELFKEVESLVKNKKLSYLDAIVYYCENNNIEIETAAAMIKSNFRIKSQIQQEGEQLNFFAKTAKLPI